MPQDKELELLRLMQQSHNQQQIIDTLQKQNAQLLHQISELQEKISQLQQQLQNALDGNTELKEQLQKLQTKLDDMLIQLKDLNRNKYGSTTESHKPSKGKSSATADESVKIEESSDDTAGDDDSEEDIVNLKPSPKKNKPKRPRNHKKHIKDNAKNLPTVTQTHSVKPEDIVCPNCLIDTVKLAHKVTTQLDSLRQSIINVEHRQEVRSCGKCKSYIVTAEKPCPPIPGSYAGPRLLAKIVVGKLADALPNYRQAKRFKRESVIIPRSTQSDWMIASAQTVRLLYDRLIADALSSKVIKTDDTWIKIQDRTLDGDKIRKGKMTSYVGDKSHPHIFFEASPDLTFQKNKERLKDFRGFVQCDAATGFDELFEEGNGKTEIGCSAHSRRKYWKCRESYVAVCNEILDIYHELYEIEEEIKHKEPNARFAARQDASKSWMDTLKKKLLGLKETLTPSDPLMKAVSYTLNHWQALIRFLDDPDFDIDNNLCERVIKEFVLVRKNALFAGSDAGAEAAAIHLSFVSSCRRLNIDPEEYLTDVFNRINALKTSEIDQLLPERWAKARAAAHQLPPSNAPP